MERIWLKQYPAGVPADIDVTQYSSLVELLEESFKKFADRKAFICMDKSISYRDLDEMSAALGAYLQSKGLKKGARVALMMPNVLQYPVSTAAVLRAGYSVVNVNPLYTPRELEHQLKDSGAEAIVVLENFATTVQQVIAKTAVKHVIVGSMGDLLGFKGVIVNLVVRKVKKMVPAWSIPGAVSFNDALAAGRSLKLSKPQLTRDDVAFLQYTGGTTGVSKGATLQHKNILANVLQNDAWLQPALKKPPHVDQLFIVCALPLYHIFALTACFLLAMRAGGVNLLIPNPRDMQGFIKELMKYQVNSFPAVNTLYNGLLNSPGFDKVDFSKLKTSFGGGMATQKPVADKWLKVTGCALSEGYGLSETSPTLTCNPADTDQFSGSIGIPVPSTFISIRDDDGKEVPLGEAGEICAKGPQVMAGYWNRPDETADVMTAGRLLPHGRHRRDGCTRLHQDRRPQEGHDPGLRLQRLSERDRGSDREPSGRAGMRRDRRRGFEIGRGGKGVHRQEGPKSFGRRNHQILRYAAHRLQGAQADRVQGRPAQDQCRQDFAPRNCATRKRRRPSGARIRWSKLPSRRATFSRSGVTPAPTAGTGATTNSMPRCAGAF